MELAIDTSTDWGGLAVSQQGKLISEFTWKPGRNHTVELYPNINLLLEAVHVDIRTIETIFVAIGPGSFNGLRAGISAAKGLAFSLNAPLKGVSTLEVEAYPYAYSGLPICSLHDAGRNEIAAARYQFKGQWFCLQEEHLTTIKNLHTEISGQTIICGELSDEHMCLVKSLLKKNALIPTSESRLRRPSFLASLGWQHLQLEGADNPSTLQPIYLRQPPITQRKKKY